MPHIIISNDTVNSIEYDETYFQFVTKYLSSNSRIIILHINRKCILLYCLQRFLFQLLGFLVKKTLFFHVNCFKIKPNYYLCDIWMEKISVITLCKVKNLIPLKHPSFLWVIEEWRGCELFPCLLKHWYSKRNKLHEFFKNYNWISFSRICNYLSVFFPNFHQILIVYILEFSLFSFWFSRQTMIEPFLLIHSVM